MSTDVALFWAVMAGWWASDNLVLLPAGGDWLRFGRDGRLRYVPGARLELRQRDLVLLNILDPFDRPVPTAAIAGPVSAAAWREARRRVRAGLPASNALGWLGLVYLVLLGALAVLSFHRPFATVLWMLLSAHVLVWAAAAAVLLRCRDRLRLTRGRSAALLLEALLVPGHLVNLGKRVWLRQVLPLPALVVGARQLRRMAPDDPRRALYAMRLSRRVDDLAQVLDAASGAAAAGTCARAVQEVRQCLTTSMPPAGW